MHSPKFLAVLVSCQKERELWSGWRFEDAVIVYGDPDQEESYRLNDNLLSLRCPDTYEDLPFKMVSAFHAFLELGVFRDYSHIIKIDGYDTEYSEQTILNLLEVDLDLLDYAGRRVETLTPGDRTYHFGKVSPDSHWHDVEYAGPYVPWACGGGSYVLSRESIEIVCRKYSLEDYKEVATEHVFEDVMIALILSEHQIFPKELSY
ncbi:MAG: hypothetical protein AAGA96_10325 [Verrucomicrobiota bacterium]